MNKLFSFAAVAIMGLAAFSGCTKAKHNVTVTYASGGTMNAVADGKAITAVNCLEASSGATHIITADFGTDTSITFNLQIPDFTTTTYSFDSVGQKYNTGYTIGTITYAGKTGSITITSITPNTSIVGSFNFTCTNGTVITGTFTAALPL